MRPRLTKQEREILGYFIIILLMVALLPIVWFWDYLQTPGFAWERLKWEYFLTESLRNWWAWVLDNWRRLW